MTREAKGAVVARTFLLWREFERQRARTERTERCISGLLNTGPLLVILAVIPGIVIWLTFSSFLLAWMWTGCVVFGLLMGAVAASDPLGNQVRQDWLRDHEHWLQTQSDADLLTYARDWAAAVTFDYQFPRDEAAVLERNAVAAECWKRGLLKQLQGIPFAPLFRGERTDAFGSMR